MRSLVNITAPNLVVVCVDAVWDDEWSGRYYHRYAEQPMAFASTLELLLGLDLFYDQICFPKATLKWRSFGQDDAIEENEESKPIPVWEAEAILEHKGDLATFVVHVQHRQNATWQGKIVWLNRDEEVYFRSALEMVRLMNQAVEECSAEKTADEP